jgi:hypothetical protein
VNRFSQRIIIVLLIFVLSSCAGLQEWGRSPAFREWAETVERSRSVQCQTYHNGISSSTHCW